MRLNIQGPKYVATPVRLKIRVLLHWAELDSCRADVLQRDALAAFQLAVAAEGDARPGGDAR